jgi:hypothetical protein
MRSAFSAEVPWIALLLAVSAAPKCAAADPSGNLPDSVPSIETIIDLIETNLKAIRALEFDYTIKADHSERTWKDIWGRQPRAKDYVISVSYARDGNSWYMRSATPNIGGAFGATGSHFHFEEASHQGRRFTRREEEKVLFFKNEADPPAKKPAQPTLMDFVGLGQDLKTVWDATCQIEHRGDRLAIVKHGPTPYGRSAYYVWFLDPSLNFHPVEYHDGVDGLHGRDGVDFTRRTIRWEVLQDATGNDVLFPTECEVVASFMGEFSRAQRLRVDKKSLRINAPVEPARFVLTRRLDEDLYDENLGMYVAEAGHTYSIDERFFRFEIQTPPADLLASNQGALPQSPVTARGDVAVRSTSGTARPWTSKYVWAGALLLVGILILVEETRRRRLRKEDRSVRKTKPPAHQGAPTHAPE